MLSPSCPPLRPLLGVPLSLSAGQSGRPRAQFPAARPTTALFRTPHYLVGSRLLGMCLRPPYLGFKAAPQARRKGQGKFPQAPQPDLKEESCVGPCPLELGVQDAPVLPGSQPPARLAWSPLPLLGPASPVCLYHFLQGLEWPLWGHEGGFPHPERTSPFPPLALGRLGPTHRSEPSAPGNPGGRKTRSETPLASELPKPPLNSSQPPQAPGCGWASGRTRLL